MNLATDPLLCPGQSAPAVGYIVTDIEMPPPEWAHRHLRVSGTQLISCNAQTLGKTVETLAALGPVLVTMSLRGLTGSAAQHEIDARAQRWSSHPGVGSLIISASPFHIPVARVWHLTRNTPEGVLDECMLALRRNRRENFEAGRDGVIAPPISTRRKPPNLPPSLLPNINVKHPGMLIPIGRVAKRMKSAVWVEISPFEAAFYYDFASNGISSPMHAVSDVLRQVRHDVDEARSITGADLLLHLDHANDLEFIRVALDCGFDSVMADASTRPIASNIRFVSEAMRLAIPYGVPVEGEIGDLDVVGSRGFSQTQTTDVARFINAVRPDYLAVCVGQDHSSHYDIEKLRRHLWKVSQYDLERGSDGRRRLFDACDAIDRQLAKGGYPTEGEERRLITSIQSALVDTNASAESILRSAETGAGCSGGVWLSRLRVKWAKCCLSAEKARLALFETGLGVGNKDCMRAEHKRSIDHMLLNEISEMVLPSTRLVLHGGSSIALADLRRLPASVARVNFGTNAYIGFANAVLSTRPGSHRVPVSRLEVAAIVRGEAKGWRGWGEKSPAFLASYEGYIQDELFEPLRPSGRCRLLSHRRNGRNAGSG